MMNKREEILQGNLWKLMIRLSLPGILGMLVISVNGLVDAFFVSHLVGTDAFAGVSYAMPLLTINAAVIALLSAGAGSVYSRAIGSNDQSLLAMLFRHLLVAILAVTVLLMIFGFAASSWLLTWLDIPARQLPFARDFYHVTLAGACFPVFGLCTSALIRSEGHTGKAMRITALAMLLNALINPLLIRYLGLGVKGSALASILAMIFYSVLTLVHLSGKNSPLQLKWGKIEPQFLHTLFRTGLPTFYMQANGFFRQLILFKLAAYSARSPSDVAIFSGIYRLFSFTAIPMFGMLQALGPVVGINYGAGKLERSQRAVTIFRSCAIILLFPVALTCFIFPQTVLSFLLANPAMSVAGSGYFRVVILVLLLMPFASGSIVFLQSTGQSALASKFTLRRELLIFLPVVLLSVYLWHYQGIYIALLAENIIYINIVYWCTRGRMQAMAG
ncbi:Na+-driven multidrug efflux pump [Mucilaginibacter oryzae]|uniref:Multidrug-efflux transporter n=1 Tax=Mucilaginibacter oryzae TaxID=468058 RepID=A0A316HG84_9SPHI|nr:MATE family efflux transporter [Mucilaginibacter oryzae]PWK77245.1 Na+-driven multidrug efflux pump [Mucilaginibacter oryzae]